jgi:hypothetical protein
MADNDQTNQIVGRYMVEFMERFVPWETLMQMEQDENGEEFMERFVPWETLMQMEQEENGEEDSSGGLYYADARG